MWLQHYTRNFWNVMCWIKQYYSSCYVHSVSEYNILCIQAKENFFSKPSFHLLGIYIVSECVCVLSSNTKNLLPAGDKPKNWRVISFWSQPLWKIRKPKIWVLLHWFGDLTVNFFSSFLTLKSYACLACNIGYCQCFVIDVMNISYCLLHFKLFYCERMEYCSLPHFQWIPMMTSNRSEITWICAMSSLKSWQLWQRYNLYE